MLLGMDLDAVRAQLRTERLTRGWSLDDLAERAKVNRSAIHDIETNRGGHPRMETIAKMVVGLGLTLSEFFAKIETAKSLHGAAEGVTTLPSSMPSSAVGAPHGDRSVPRPAPIIDDTNTLLASVAQGSIAVARSVRDLVSELRAAREHAAAPRVRKAARPARNRRTRSA